MHRLFIPIYLILFYLPNLSSAQWIEQQSGTSAALWDIKFIDANTGFISGQGRILKTTNSGINWSHLNIPPQSLDNPLYCIHPVNENVIYCAGGFEAIIKSTDGGSTWTVLSDSTFGDGSTYFTCFFVNESTGWVSGTGDKVLKTTNGGLSFDTINLDPQAGFIRQMYFRNETEGIIAGNSSSIYKTTNSGENWNNVNVPVGGTGYSLRGLTFPNFETGWLFSTSRKVFKTTDFGSNWDSLLSVPTNGFDIYCADFTSIDTGYVTGQIVMYKTTDGAISWVQEKIPTNPPIGAKNSIHFINNSTGWFCTSFGKIFKTTTGGEPIVSISPINTNIPTKIKLYQNYPNPFNPITTIEYSLPNSGQVNIKIYDLTGRMVDEPVNSFHTVGNYLINYNAGHLASGVYFYKLTFEDRSLVKKFILIK